MEEFREQKLLGLFELDQNGKVLYSSIEGDDGSLSRQRSFHGTNFFTDIASFTNTVDLQRRFDLFRLAETLSCSFSFTCEYSDGALPVRVVMARLSTNADCSFLVHLRKP